MITTGRWLLGRILKVAFFLPNTQFGCKSKQNKNKIKKEKKVKINENKLVLYIVVKRTLTGRKTIIGGVNSGNSWIYRKLTLKDNEEQGKEETGNGNMVVILRKWYNRAFTFTFTFRTKSVLYPSGIFVFG